VKNPLVRDLYCASGPSCMSRCSGGAYGARRGGQPPLGTDPAASPPARSDGGRRSAARPAARRAGVFALLVSHPGLASTATPRAPSICWPTRCAASIPDGVASLQAGERATYQMAGRLPFGYSCVGWSGCDDGCWEKVETAEERCGPGESAGRSRWRPRLRWPSASTGGAGARDEAEARAISMREMTLIRTKLGLAN